MAQDRLRREIESLLRGYWRAGLLATALREPVLGSRSLSVPPWRDSGPEPEPIPAWICVPTSPTARYGYTTDWVPRTQYDNCTHSEIWRVDETGVAPTDARSRGFDSRVVGTTRISWGPALATPADGCTPMRTYRDLWADNVRIYTEEYTTILSATRATIGGQLCWRWIAGTESMGLATELTIRTLPVGRPSSEVMTLVVTGITVDGGAAIQPQAQISEDGQRVVVLARNYVDDTAAYACTIGEETTGTLEGVLVEAHGVHDWQYDVTANVVTASGSYRRPFRVDIGDSSPIVWAADVRYHGTYLRIENVDYQHNVRHVAFGEWVAWAGDWTWSTGQWSASIDLRIYRGSDLLITRTLLDDAYDRVDTPTLPDLGDPQYMWPELQSVRPYFDPNDIVDWSHETCRHPADECEYTDYHQALGWCSGKCGSPIVPGTAVTVRTSNQTPVVVLPEGCAGNSASLLTLGAAELHYRVDVNTEYRTHGGTGARSVILLGSYGTVTLPCGVGDPGDIHVPWGEDEAGFLASFIEQTRVLGWRNQNYQGGAIDDGVLSVATVRYTRPGVGVNEFGESYQHGAVLTVDGQQVSWAPADASSAGATLYGLGWA